MKWKESLKCVKYTVHKKMSTDKANITESAGDSPAKKGLLWRAGLFFMFVFCMLASLAQVSCSPVSFDLYFTFLMLQMNDPDPVLWMVSTSLDCILASWN